GVRTYALSDCFSTIETTIRTAPEPETSMNERLRIGTQRQQIPFHHATSGDFHTRSAYLGQRAAIGRHRVASTAMGKRLHSCAWAMLVGLAGVMISAAVWAHGASSKLHGEVTAAERQGFDEARPAFERHCFRCHSQNGPKDGKNSAKAKAQARAHVDMTSYPFGGHHAGEAGA